MTLLLIIALKSRDLKSNGNMVFNGNIICVIKGFLPFKIFEIFCHKNWVQLSTDWGQKISMFINLFIFTSLIRNNIKNDILYDV